MSSNKLSDSAFLIEKDSIMARMQTTNEYLFKCTSLLPIIWLAMLYLFLISCIIDLGHYPQPSLNDPKSIGLTFLYYGSIIGFLASFYGSLLWVVSLLISLYHKSVSKKHLVLFLIGLTIALIQLIYDPGQVIYWLLD